MPQGITWVCSGQSVPSGGTPLDSFYYYFTIFSFSLRPLVPAGTARQRAAEGSVGERNHSQHGGGAAGVHGH